MPHLSAVGISGIQAGEDVKPVDAELAGIRIVADMTGLEQSEVLAVIGMGTVPRLRDDAADAAVVEGKAPKCLASRMMGKPWLSSEQKTREGMILPGVKPSDR